MEVGVRKCRSQNVGCFGKLNRKGDVGQGVGRDPGKSGEWEVGVLNARGCLSHAVGGEELMGSHMGFRRRILQRQQAGL